MDVLIKLTIPGYIYRFYHNASLHVADSSPEQLMSDALSAYAGLLSADIANRNKPLPESVEISEGYSEPSRSR